MSSMNNVKSKRLVFSLQGGAILYSGNTFLDHKNFSREDKHLSNKTGGITGAKQQSILSDKVQIFNKTSFLITVEPFIDL